jgi:hypothetical protein
MQILIFLALLVCFSYILTRAIYDSLYTMTGITQKRRDEAIMSLYTRDVIGLQCFAGNNMGPNALPEPAKIVLSRYCFLAQKIV